MRLPIALVLAALAVAAGSDAALKGDDTRPNVVVLMTDDQTVESMRVMPNVRRLLSDRGVTFDSSFVSLPLCCPSRATFLTGQYAHNHGVLSNHPPRGGYAKLDGSSTLPVWLRRAGYYTAHVGKYLNGYGELVPNEVPPGWDEWHTTTDPETYRYYGYLMNENGTVVSYGYDPSDYRTDVESRKAQDVIRRRAGGPRPFFLVVSFLAPHGGGPPSLVTVPQAPVPALRDAGTFANEPLPPRRSFDEADVSDKPAEIRRLPRLSPKAIAQVTERYRVRLESLLAVDEAVAAIVGELRRTGELDNTLILFTSDNGFFHGEHRLAVGKSRLYEPAIRVPLVIRGPGIPPGVHVDEPVANVDWAPTILDEAGVRPGLPQDGRSLLPLAADPDLHWGRDILLEGTSRAYEGIRTPRFVYAEHASGERELYDLWRDPEELQSVHARPAYRAVRHELARRLHLLRDCVGKACSAGPDVDVRAVRACGHGLGTLELEGGDRREVQRLVVDLGEQRLATDRRAPFRIVFRLRPVTMHVRVQVLLDDGREVTADRALRACG